MIDYEEELKKFEPCMDVADTEGAIFEHELKDILDVCRDSTRIKLADEKGTALTANLHKRDITSEFDNLKVLNICTRYQGNGHTVRFYLLITLDTGGRVLHC